MHEKNGTLHLANYVDICKSYGIKTTAINSGNSFMFVTHRAALTPVTDRNGDL